MAWFLQKVSDLLGVGEDSRGSRGDWTASVLPKLLDWDYGVSPRRTLAGRRGDSMSTPPLHPMRIITDMELNLHY